jgi:hypothetical protein
MKMFVPFAVTAAALASPVAAQSTAPYYVAIPMAQPSADHLVTRTAAWRLAGGAYVANQAPERPEILCQLVAGQAGELASFSVKGQPLAADKLARCNAKVARSSAQIANNAK